MGVLNIATFAPTIVSVAEAEFILNDGFDDVVDSEPEELDYDLPPRPARRTRHRSGRKGSSCAPTSIRQNAGNRKKRRHENDLYLMNISLEDESNEAYEDFSPVSFSAFTQLLMETEKMQVWNDFVDKTEDEQWKILKNVEGGEGDYQSTEEARIEELQTDVLKINRCDIRNVHPAAFSPEKHFLKLDRELQRLLKSGQSELNLLQDLEEQLTNFFKACPKDVFLAQLENGYERMHLHAICQYLDLHSRSYTDSGVRHTKVKNPRRQFSTPPVLLSSYVARLAS